MKIKRKLLIVAIATCIALIFCVPLTIVLLYASSGIFGLFIIGCLVLIQAPIFYLVTRLQPHRDEE